MIAADALLELLARVGANGGEPTIVGGLELTEWPLGTFETLKTSGLLTRTRSATSVVCPGCERQCVMPVQVVTAANEDSSAFVVCDKRDDINRVPVSPGALEQWQASGESIATLIARMLGIRRPAVQNAARDKWRIGLMRSGSKGSHVLLSADGELKVTLAGHSVALSEVLYLAGNEFAIDRQRLEECVRNPRAGGGDAESAQVRQDRILNRVQELRSAGVRGFRKQVAEEEDLSVSRIKQIEDEARKRQGRGTTLKKKKA